VETLEPIILSLDAKDLAAKLRTDDWEEIQHLLESVKNLINAKAAYRVCFIEERLEASVIIEGTCFTSRVLRKNLDSVGRVFPFVITIGRGLEERADGANDLLKKYYLDTIGNIALVKALKHLENHLRSKFALKGLSYMSPGSLENWPIEEQIPLFSLLAGVERLIGVTLSESLIMIPKKSLSGVYFPTETSFSSCQLCPRERCEARKAKYNEELAREYGIQQ
jgi:hypothetical protein